MRSTPDTQLYRIHGLLVKSEVPIDGVRVDATRRPLLSNPFRAHRDHLDYRVVLGHARDVPQGPPAGTLLAEHAGIGFWASQSPGEPSRWTLRYSEICEVTLDRPRRTITVHPSPGAEMGMIPIFLNGPIFAHVLAMNDQLALHASAVEVDGRALAILGSSGSGKSTLAAVLCARGARLVSDDTLRVEVSQGRVICFPGSLAIRLRPGVAELANELADAEVQTTADGRTAVFPSQVAQGPVRLEAAIVPSIRRHHRRLEVQARNPMDGFVDLLRYPRLTGWRRGEPIGRLFELTTEVSELLGVYRASVPWGPPFVEGLADDLLSVAGMALPGDSALGPSVRARGEETARG